MSSDYHTIAWFENLTGDEVGLAGRIIASLDPTELEDGKPKWSEEMRELISAAQEAVAYDDESDEDESDEDSGESAEYEQDEEGEGFTKPLPDPDTKY